MCVCMSGSNILTCSLLSMTATQRKLLSYGDLTLLGEKFLAAQLHNNLYVPLRAYIHVHVHVCIGADTVNGGGYFLNKIIYSMISAFILTYICIHTYVCAKTPYRVLYVCTYVHNYYSCSTYM